MVLPGRFRPTPMPRFPTPAPGVRDAPQTPRRQAGRQGASVRSPPVAWHKNLPTAAGGWCEGGHRRGGRVENGTPDCRLGRRSEPDRACTPTPIPARDPPGPSPTDGWGQGKSPDKVRFLGKPKVPHCSLRTVNGAEMASTSTVTTSPLSFNGAAPRTVRRSAMAELERDRNGAFNGAAPRTVRRCAGGHGAG